MSVQTLEWNQMPPADTCGGAVTIGNFDGVHRGHAALLAEVRKQARAVHGPALAVTFDPHPLQLLRPESFEPVLTARAQRAELLQRCGADHVIFLKTTPALLQLSAAEFFEQVVRKRLAARAIVEGRNFGFGRNREGNIETLAGLCAGAGVRLTIVAPVLFDGRPVSSSRVRQALLRGAVGEAADMLDCPYRLTGTVGTGQRRGRKIGFPTANLEGIETLIPKDGVYAVRAWLGERSWPAAVNVGPNPTFGEIIRKVEAHLIGFEGELLGDLLTIDFVERLRDTQRFASVPDLVAQLRRDVERVHALVGPDAYRGGKQ